MDQYISLPILSTILSIFLFVGSYQLGKILVSHLKLFQILRLISEPEFLYPVFGFVFLLVTLFPLTAFTNSAELILRSTAIFLIILSFFFFLNIKSLRFNSPFKQKDYLYYLLIIFVVLYFLLSLSPLTSADVLDYHSGVALNILRFNKYTLFPEWFTGLQSGAGEVLIALGFSVGSEQFGSLVQFSSVLVFTGIILKFTKINKIFSSDYFIILTVLSCPVLIFLLSGNKPQIFYSSLIFICLAFNFVKFHNQKEIFKVYLIINVFLCCAVLGKFSFNLVGLIIWIYSTINFFNKTKNYQLFLIPIFIFFIMYFPFILWKYENLGGNIITYFFSPFPLHLPGYENFLNHNRGSQEIPFPNFLFYTTPSRFTEFLAANTLFLLIIILKFKTNKKILHVLYLSFFFIVISNLYASPSARYYLDVILWFSLAICFVKNLKLKNIFEYFFYPQIIVVFIVLIYSCYSFLPGSFSQKNYIKVKNNYAYMYSGMYWVNQNIPKGSNIIIMNRPISLYKEFSVSGGFNYFTDFEQSKFYKNLIKKYNLEYLVYFGSQLDLRHMNNCITEIYKKKENVGFHATRNPFNKGGNYNAYIFYFDQKRLDNC